MSARGRIAVRSWRPSSVALADREAPDLILLGEQAIDDDMNATGVPSISHERRPKSQRSKSFPTGERPTIARQ
jgi:hypothetical protein